MGMQEFRDKANAYAARHGYQCVFVASNIPGRYMARFYVGAEWVEGWDAEVSE